MRAPLDHITELDDELYHWTLFIGPQSHYYLPQWQVLKNGAPGSFNVYGLLFGVLWMLYRRLYLYALVVMVLFLVEGSFVHLIIREFSIQLPAGGLLFFRIAFWNILIGLSGNWLYWQHASQKIEQIEAQYPPEECEQRLRLSGGVSWVPVIVFVILSISLLILEPYLTP